MDYHGVGMKYAYNFILFPTTSLCSASYLGSRHDAARSRSSGACSNRSILSAARAQAAASRQMSMEGTDGRTDGRRIVT